VAHTAVLATPTHTHIAHPSHIYMISTECVFGVVIAFCNLCSRRPPQKLSAFCLHVPRNPAPSPSLCATASSSVCGIYWCTLSIIMTAAWRPKRASRSQVGLSLCPRFEFADWAIFLTRLRLIFSRYECALWHLTCASVSECSWCQESVWKLVRFVRFVMVITSSWAFVRLKLILMVAVVKGEGWKIRAGFWSTLAMLCHTIS